MQISKDLREVFDKNGLTEEWAQRLYSETRILITDTNGKLIQKPVEGDDWNILDDISWDIWFEVDCKIEDRIRIGFEFYELFPLYYQGLNYLYSAFRDGKIKEKHLREEIFNKFARYLSSEELCFYDSVTYILWVEFFEGGGGENGQIARDAWTTIVNSKFITEKGKIRLLRVSGVAPVDLKEKLYYELLPKKEYHKDIFDSIVYSLYDGYGLYDVKIIKDVFSRLIDIDKNSHNYEMFCKRIKELEIKDIEC